MKKYFQIVVVLMCWVGLACQRGSESANNRKELHLAIWTNYLTDDMLKRFENASGYRVKVSHYSSNEELLAKMQAGAEGFDIVVPSDYMVQAMKELALLQALDTKKLKYFQELDPKVLHQYFDPKNEVSVPLSWGTTGIAFNQKVVKSPLKGWKDFFKNSEIAGRQTMLDDVRESLGAALKADGYSLNTRDRRELEAARATLVKAKPRLKGFNSETLPILVSGDIVAAQAYSHDALIASQQTHGAIRYLIPEEGCTFWTDNIVIPRGMKDSEGAYALIDFLISAEVEADRARRLFTAPSNRKAISLLSADLQKNEAMFPSDKTLKRCEMLQDLGESLALWDRMWTEVKAQ